MKSENQDTFEALPIEVLQSALSPAKMKVLNVLYRYNSLDETIEKGSFYISNEQLKEEAQIGESKKTFYDVISFFTSNKFITRQSGSRTKEEGAVASTYILHDEVILDWAIAHPKKGKGTPSMGTPKKSKCTDEVAELRAEIKRMREEIAELRALLMGTPMGTPLMGTPMEENRERCTPEPEKEKEITNPIVTSSNPDMGLPICAREENDTDEGTPNNGEVNPSNADEGDKAIFNKIEGYDPASVDNPNDEEINKSQATANKASGSVATPQTVQTTTDEGKTRQSANVGANQMSGNTNLKPEERINQLDALNLWKMQTPNVNPIELAKEVGALLVHKDVLCQGKAYTTAEEIGCYLALYADDVETLNKIEETLTAAHIEVHGSSTSKIDYAYNERRKQLSNPQTLETSPEPHQSHADGQDEETITNEQKRAQKRPDEAGEGLKVDKTIDALLTKLANLNAQFVAGDHEAAQKAEKLMNKVCKCCGETESIGVLNWCALNIPTMLEKHGRVLGTNVNLYLSVIPNVIANRRKELLAA